MIRSGCAIWIADPWKTVASSTLKGNQRRYEYEVLCRLREVLPFGVEVTVVADRGFGDCKLFYTLTTELAFEPLAKRVIGRVFPWRRRRGEGRSAGGMQRSQDGSDRAREAGDTGVHGACLPVMRASAREERWRMSFTSRSSLRLFSIHSR